jgi:hypothetical protein
MAMDKYYNGSCANQVMRKNGELGDVSGVDAADECNRLDKRITELERKLELANLTNEIQVERLEELEAQLGQVRVLPPYLFANEENYQIFRKALNRSEDDE